MPARETKLPFPLGGVTKNSSYQEAEPHTARDALNVAPDASIESRTRGGSRPGLTKRYNDGAGDQPLFVVRVSGGDDTRVYEYLVVGTSDNIYLGQSIASGAVVPITYTEVFAALSGNLATEDGDTLITEGNDNLVIDTFNTTGVNVNVVTQYQDSVIIGSDGGVLASASDGTLDGAGTSFDSATYTDWTSISGESVDVEQHYLEITSTGAGGLATARTYKISSVAAGALTLAEAASTGAETSLSFRVVNAPRDLDPNTPTIDVLTPTAGFVPLSPDTSTSESIPVDAVITYRDRLVWGVNRTWHMSRQGDPGDYDYAADPEDPARALVGTTAGPGQPADPIVAFATSGYDYLIIFSEASTWVMRGDPGYGGQLYQASHAVGCISNTAWCNTDVTDIYFLAKDGLYHMAPNAGGIKAVSPGKLPRELRGLDRDNFFVTLVYDPEDDTILIFAVPKGGGEGSHFIYDIRTDSFWPFKITTNSYQPVNAVTFGGSPVTSRKAVLASFDGFIRSWTGSDDDGMAIVSHVILGPYPISDDSDLEGMVGEVIAIMDKASEDVTVELYVSPTAEGATDDAIAGTSPFYSFTASAGRNPTKRPRARGTAICVRLSATGKWAFEGLIGKFASLGKNRRF